MTAQEKMIARLRDLCQQEKRLVAGLLYGSFTIGEADEYSDIECALFFEEQAFAALDYQSWVAQIEPLDIFFKDDFGHFTAIFSNLVRGEFHFEPASQLSKVVSWQGNAWFPSLEATVLLDRTGELARHLQVLLAPLPERDVLEQAQSLSFSFINMILFGTNVLARGEMARALDLLSSVQRYLLWLVRLVEHQTFHWPSPAKGFEHDISSQAYQRYKSCTATLDAQDLLTAYRAAWIWGKELLSILTQRHAFLFPQSLSMQIDQRLSSGQA